MFESALFCASCGTQTGKALAASASGPTVDITPAPTWFVGYATGQQGGPFTEDEVKSMIARQQIKITDSVAVQGSATWVPITQSPFAQSIVQQASIHRLASSTCPQCGGAMAVVVRRSGASKGFFILGLLTIWMFGFGVIFLIIGYIIGRNPAPRYECPRCKYKAS
jgi:predicted RNA-binding Zn-ribbon protein involved in translation (DUF1610 family)